MNTDIRIQISFANHIKRKKLQNRLKAEGVLALIDLWLYAGENHPDGILKNMTAEDVELAANWQGESESFVNTLIEIGFLDNTGEWYLLHDWSEHNPYAMHAPERKERAKKAANKRWGNQQACSEHANSMQDVQLSNAPSPSPSPSPIPDPTPIPTPVVEAEAENSEKEIFITIPLNDKSEYPVYASMIEEWKNLYPKVDIEQQLRAIRGWNISNPARRKTKRGILAHINSWLSDKQNQGGNNGNGSGSSGGTGKTFGKAQSDNQPYPIDYELGPG